MKGPDYMYVQPHFIVSREQVALGNEITYENACIELSNAFVQTQHQGKMNRGGGRGYV